jgi:hypothetical protein
MTKGEVQKLFDDSRDVLHAAQISETGPGKSFMGMVRKKRDHERESVELSPVMSDNVREDMRYKLGFVQALNWILNSEHDLKRHLKMMEETNA